MKFKVPITDYISPPAVDEERALADIAEVFCLEQVEESGLAGKIEEADALIVFHTIQISASSIRRLQKCRAIVRCGVGYDNVDLAAAGAKGIYVCNVPDYGTDEVADHALALMLACARGLLFTERGLRKTLSPWDFLAASPLRRIAGATLGIIGLGRIGTATALRAKGFRMNVVACDPYLPDGYDKALGVTMRPLDALMSVSDIVSVHTPDPGDDQNRRGRSAGENETPWNLDQHRPREMRGRYGRCGGLKGGQNRRRRAGCPAR